MHLCAYFSLQRHDIAGFHTEGGAGTFPPQPQFSLPRNLEIDYGYYVSYYVSSKYSEILSQIASEAI